MSRQCEICGKKPQFGNNVSHSNNITKRRCQKKLKTHYHENKIMDSRNGHRCFVRPGSRTRTHNHR